MPSYCSQIPPRLIFSLFIEPFGASWFGLSLLLFLYGVICYRRCFEFLGIDSDFPSRFDLAQVGGLRFVQDGGRNESEGTLISWKSADE